MTTQDLRIGNWVEETHSGESGKVDMVVLSIIDRMSNHSYRPIPLTEEWLLKFGFEKGSHGESSNFYYLRRNGNGYDFIAKPNSICWFIFRGNQDLNECTYIHQLQNLYFGLTGEELELKP